MAITLTEFSGAPLPAPTRQRISGIDFDAVCRADAVAVCEQALRDNRPLTIGVVNAAKAVSMRDNELLASSVLESDLVLADGQSIVWASRLLGRPLPERVAGIDLFTDLLCSADSHGYRVYFLGATEDALERMLAGVMRAHPGLVVAGYHNGYFDMDTEAASIAAQIRASRADMLFVGMTSPRKEIFLARHGDATGTIIRHGVGGSFDVLAGITKRAPRPVQRLGLEWLFRLLQEPTRLAGRYARTNTAYLGLLLRELLRRDVTVPLPVSIPYPQTPTA
jgi:N-acetylglucosaminyldiphosphoundecaprenol N-acetyl-beta-D-mannosaminyltransferase